MTTKERKRRERICQIFAIPEFLVSWLDQFFEAQELDLILTLASGPLPLEELAAKSGRKLDTAAENDSFQRFLKRAYTRGIINPGIDGDIELADFHVRYEFWALFEGWKDVPNEIRERLNAWELDHYETQKREEIEALKAGKNSDIHGRAEYLLLHETEALLDRAEHIYLWPCNCRAMMGRCKKPIYTCLRFTNDRDIGWEISRERAKELIYQAHQQGLMQIGEIRRKADGSMTGGLCNCCADCCFPHLVAERLESQKIWPRSRYVVEYDSECCKNCGLCVRRCPFQAFSQQGKSIEFDVERCRGCGLCVTACPAGAIKMLPIE